MAMGRKSRTTRDDVDARVPARAAERSSAGVVSSERGFTTTHPCAVEDLIVVRRDECAGPHY